MSFKQKFTLLLAAFALVTSTVLAAGAPPNVKRVAATIENGILTVEWDAVTDEAGIDFYRVYFSHTSILGSNGNYDDFERTAGNETVYTFTKLPLGSPTIVVSVLAVNAAGIESEGFETEASVSVAQSATASVASSASSSAVATTGIPMAIASAEVVSSTGIVLTFTKTVAITPAVTTEYFVVIDASGAMLGVTRVETSGYSILVHTTPQLKNKEYTLGILRPVAAFDGTHLSQTNMQHRLRGFAGDDEPTTTIASSSASMPPAYVRNPLLPIADPRLPPDVVRDPMPPVRKPLPDSGLGLTGIIAISGLFAGRRLARRKS